MNKWKIVRVSYMVLLICYLGNLTYAQVRTELNPFTDKTRVVLSPPPTASELGKYVEVPVSLYTGIPNISVPIFQVEENGYKLDISLSYHASGIKVQ